MEAFESRTRESLGEYVGEVICAGYAADVDSAILGAFTDIVEPDINVFAAGMVGGIIGKRKSAVVVAEQEGGTGSKKA